MNAKDIIRLQHMLDYARETNKFIIDRSRDDLNNDNILTFALMKGIEIIGEAAANISQETKEQLSQIDWFDIIGMRNRLVHVYFNIDLDIVWNTTENSLPELIEKLEMLPELK